MDRQTTSGTNKPNDYDRLQQILDKVRDLKQSLANFFLEYEHGQPSWPTILGQMNVLLSQISTLRTNIRHSLSMIRSNCIVPMCLSPDVDPGVEQLTERRLSIFNHDFMPQLLRTKNLPEIEERERVLSSTSVVNNLNSSFSRSNPMPNEVHTRIQELNASLNAIGEIFVQTKQFTEKSDRQFDSQRFFNRDDMGHLQGAMSNGIGLKGPAVTSAAMMNNDQTNLNAQTSAQSQRQQAPNVRIKTVAKPNRQ